MSAAPARVISSSSSSSFVEPLLLAAASSAAANSHHQVRQRGHLVRTLAASSSSNTLLRSDFDLQEGLTTDVKRMLRQRQKKSGGGREMLVTIDNLKRLCIDHFFEEEIEGAMATGACTRLLHSDDLFDATLAFRLLREAGHDVSAKEDVLRRFIDGVSGDFKLSLNNDVRGLLGLHDMSHLDVGGEEAALLHRAKEFSSSHLASAVRHHLRYLQSLPSSCRDAAVERLAVAEFQLNKSLHQREMREIKRWWMDLGLAEEIPVVRDQVMKWYMWSMAALQGSSFSRYRVYVVDDIFDLVGTLEELSAFTEAVKMWDTAAADSLPSCMRSCYKALHTVTNEIAEIAHKEHGSNPINRLRKAWVVLFDGFMVEARWLATDQVPTAEDYLRNGVVTSGVPLTFLHIFSMLGYDDPSTEEEEEAIIDHMPSIISCPAKILRLWDDMGSAEDEAQEGFDGSYRDFYLMENPSRSPGEAEAHMRGLIAREWVELNRECFCRRTFPSDIAQVCLNTARMVSVMYSYNKEQRLLVLEDYAAMMLVL
uniref:Uncharacterized protein n=1 Tax=Zea mays TaxID=4577 RepID=A0A804PDV5_MAIZE